MNLQTNLFCLNLYALSMENLRKTYPLGILTVNRMKNFTTDIKYSIFLGLYLNWLRSNEVLQKLSVGSNGGSFAVGYWDNILIPKVDECFMDQLVLLYNNDVELNPSVFNLDLLDEAGIYQLNSFLIKCKALLNKLCEDIKDDSLKDKQYYINYLNC